MTFEELKQVFLNVRMNREKGIYAPHKPLLLLLTLSRYYSKCSNCFKFEELADTMAELLKQFSPYQSSIHPEYPFLKLANDGIWNISANEDINTKKEYSASKLTKLNAESAFNPEIEAALKADLNYVPGLIGEILSEFFPETIHNGTQLEEVLLKYQGKQVRLPLNPSENPAVEYLNWHWENIFKRPERYFERLDALDIAAEG